MNDVIQKIYDIGIVPVIAIDDADKAVPLAKALVKGGLPAAEVTFRTAAAEEAIKRIVAEVPEMLVGAGTVLTKEQADRAIAAGVKFIVSPGFNPEITKYVIDKGMLMMPGTATPGEMEQAMSMGLDVVKFSPAEQNGGVAKLKAVAGPYTNLRWMPTGGVNAKNLLDYLSFNKIVACGGTWMVKKDLIEAENWDEIERLTREAVNTMLGFEVKHIGINTGNAEEAMKAAKLFELMFGFDVSEGNSSIFCGSRAIEIMKKQYLGKNGHIAIGTNTLPRAIAYYFKSAASSSTRRPPAPRPFTSKTRSPVSPSTSCRSNFYSFAQQGCKKRPELRHLRFNVFIIADKIDHLEFTFGGGEANVAVSLANYGLDAAYVTKLPAHAIGQAAVNSLRRYGVDTSKITRGGDRVGIYFNEKGASQRPSVCIYDRAHSAISEATTADFDWDAIFEGVEWLHFTGITPALGEVALSATSLANQVFFIYTVAIFGVAGGAIVLCSQYPMWWRSARRPARRESSWREDQLRAELPRKLWTRDEARAAMTELCQYVDVCISNEEDAKDVFGIEAENTDITGGELNKEGYKSVAKQLADKFNFEMVAITLRESKSAFDNDWSAMLYNVAKDEYRFSKLYHLHIIDRIGGGDSFGGGLIYALRSGKDTQPRWSSRWRLRPEALHRGRLQLRHRARSGKAGGRRRFRTCTTVISAYRYTIDTPVFPVFKESSSTQTLITSQKQRGRPAGRLLCTGEAGGDPCKPKIRKFM